MAKPFDPHTMGPLTFHADPSHAWLAVPLNALEDLGITKKISRYSYKGKRLAYLEEDCDAPVFLEAFIAKYAFRPDWKESFSNRRSRIRSMPSYSY